MKSFEDTVLVMCLMVAMFVGGCVAGISTDTKEWRADCIKRGFAEHNAQTGKWQWIEKKDENE